MIDGLLFGLNYLKHRLTGGKNPSAYYMLIGDDVIPFLNSDFSDDSKPLWLNLGYWKESNTYSEACASLAKLLGESADLGPGDRILNVGFGFGEQDIVWIELFNVRHITGINITPLHIEIASRKAKTKIWRTVSTLGLGLLPVWALKMRNLIKF